MSNYDDEEEGAGPETENYCDFTVYVTDASGKKGLVVEATSVDTEINLMNILSSNDVSEQKVHHRIERQTK